MIYQRKYRIACLWLGGLFLALGFFAWGGLPRSTPEIEIRRAIVVRPAEKRRALEDLTDVPVARPATGGWLQSFGGYTGHIVRKGETIRDLASAGGSTESLIASYNAIRGPLAAGRCVIIPNLQNAINTLKSEPFIVEHATTRHARVALTLDAGSTAEPLPRILNALSKRRIKITFFVTGYFVRDNPELVRQIAADGHEFGNHSLSHPDLRHVDDKRLLRELMETERLLLATAGASTRPFFRPPYGEYDNHVLLTAENLGFIPVYWTLDSLDSVGAKKNGDFLYNRVTGKLSAEQLRGAIILMHVDSMGTADALPRILDRYAEMGLEVCKLSRLLNDT
jgi:peptidoglycan/xylan/chitin deacetylase (PgdA/CDA1 family)